jgi:hypothetical protein
MRIYFYCTFGIKNSFQSLLTDFDRRSEETKKHFERILAAEKENLQQQFDLERENIQQMSEKFSSEQKVKFQNNIKQLEEMISTLKSAHESLGSHFNSLLFKKVTFYSLIKLD